MKPSTLIFVFIILALSGGAGLFYFHYQMPDVEYISSDVNERLLKIDSLDSNISELALRSRANLDTNYDMLVRSTGLLSQAMSDLEITYFADPSLKASLLEKRFVGFRNALESKIDLIENFKSHNSVLRNSEKYAPIVGGNLAAVAEKSGLDDVAKLYKSIVLEVFNYSKRGRDVSPAVLMDLVVKIPATEDLMPEIALSRIIELANHVSTLVEEKNQTDLYLSKVLSTTSSGQLDELYKAWNAHLSKFYQAREKFFVVILAYIIVLLLFTAYIALKLRDLYVNLDGQVAMRTSEVKKAYEELNQSEKQLMQTEKMASLGQLVAGVAHEINTPLSYITCNLDTVRSNMKDFNVILETSRLMSAIISRKPLDKEKLSVVIKRNVIAYRDINNRGTVSGIDELLNDSTYGLNEISQLVSSLKDFSRLDTSDTSNTDIHNGLDATIKICGNLIGNRRLIKNYDADLPNVEGVPAQLNQVFMNILSNAAQATDDNDGVIEISTVVLEGENVQVTIKDNGIGMNEETSACMFDPFFTTKDVNEGTGLGLSIAYKIIKSHGGTINVKSMPGQGTEIVILLPISQQVENVISMENYK